MCITPSFILKVSQICPHLGLSDLGLPLVHGPAGVHGRAGVPGNAMGQKRVPAPVLLLGSFLVSLCHLTQIKTTTFEATMAIWSFKG